ncbi:MAG: gliding motility-associated protein GldE [Bacteroidia bacterium]
MVILIMLAISTITSAAENAYFSLTPSDIADLKQDEKKSAEYAIKLLKEPDEESAGKTLLASILLINNFTNIFVVISSSLLLSMLFQLELYPVGGFLFEVVLITFIIVLISEVTPKIYATQNAVSVVHRMSIPLYYSQKLLKPFIWVLTKSSDFLDKYFETKQQTVSLEELNHAIEITSDEDLTDEKNILKSLVNFGNISVKQIMKSRLDVMAVEHSSSFEELMAKVNEWGYSRIPVYEETFDSISGVLYIKDLLPYVNHPDGLDWTKLIRPAFFVPEFKKIDDLLNEFKAKQIHMALVVDEYGGTLGIVTLEDILEEIFGEINDEFDEEELTYSKLDEMNYVFEGKISINDFIKITEIEAGYFDDVKGEADSLAGLIMEISQNIPSIGDQIEYGIFNFTVESADKRKVNRIKVTITPEPSETE